MAPFGGLGSIVGADIIAYVKLSGADTFNRDLDKLNASAGSFGKTMNATMNAALVAGAAVFVASSAAAITFESSFAGVLKTTDGLTDSLGNINAEGVKLSQEFRKLALEIPVSVNELNRIGELGGQLGIAKESLITFTSVIAKLGATTDLSYEQGAMAIAQFINVTKSVVPVGVSVDQQLERIASTLVDLGNNSVATESGIMNFAQRIAGAGATVGMTQDQILSFGAALSSVGLNAEMGGTAISKLMIEMKSATETGGSDLDKFAKAAHMSVGEFKTLFEEDAAAALTKFIEGLNQTSKDGESVIQVLNGLGISETRMRSAILLSANAGDLLNKTLGIGAKAYSENSAMAEEFAKRVATVKSQLQLLGNAVYDVLIDLGQEFLPTIKAVAKAMADHPGIIKAIITALMAAGGLVAAYKLVIAAQTAWKALNAISLFSKFAVSVGASSMAMTALGAVAVFAIAEVINLAGAISKYKDAQDELARSNEQVEKLNIRIERGMGSMNSALYKLGQRARTDMVVMNGKLWEVGDAIDEINKLMDEGHVTDISLQFSEAAEETAKAAKYLADYESNLELLSETGIETTEQIQEQVKGLEKLKTAFSDDAFVAAELSSSIDELKEKLFYANLDAGKYAITSEVVADALRNHAIATRDVKAEIEALTDPMKELETSTFDEVYAARELEKAQREAANAMDAFDSILGPMTGRMGVWGDAINIVVDSFMSGGFGLNTALSLAGLAFETLFGETEKWSWDEYASEIWGANSAVLEIVDNISALNDEFGQYDLIDALTVRYIALRTQIIYLNATNQENTQTWRDATAEMALVGEQLERLRLAFTFVDQTIQEQSQYITENAIAAWERYAGAIPDDKTREWLLLLEENTADLEALRGTLAVGSQAWLDNEEAILRNKYVMGLINGDWADYAEYVRDANLTMEQAAMFFESLGYEGEQLDNALLELGYTTYNSGQAIKTAGQNADDAALSFNGLTSEVEEINTEIAYWEKYLKEAETQQAALNAELEEATRILNEQVGALESNIAEWEKQIAAIDEELNWNIDLTPPTLEEIGLAMQETKDKIAAASAELAGIELKIAGLEAEKQLAIDNYISSINILISKAGELQIAWGDSTDTTISNFETLFGGGADSWTSKALAAIEQLKYFKIDLDTTDADESIAGTIVKMQEYLGTLSPGSPAYNAARDSLNNLITQYNTLGTSFSTEVGVNFNNQQALAGIDEIGTTYDAQKTELENNAALITMNLSDYRGMLLYMGWAYQDKIDELNAIKATLQVDILGAQTKINTLRNDYSALKSYIESQIAALQVNSAAANITIANLRASLTSLVNTGWTIPVTITASGTIQPSYHSGGMIYHDGGWMTAHDGLSLGQYGSMKEVPFLGLEGEYVLNPNIGRKFGEAALDAFNVSGNPAVLGGESRQAQPTVELKPEFTIMNAAPETFVTWTDKYIHPRIRDNDDRQIKSDRFK